MADGVYWDRAKETRTRTEREAEVLVTAKSNFALSTRCSPSTAPTTTSMASIRIR
jgi:hypothetical protein